CVDGVQHVRRRHVRDVRVLRPAAQPAQIADPYRTVARGGEGDLVETCLGQCGELLTETELVEQRHRRRVHRVAPEIAQEVPVLDRKSTRLNSSHVKNSY